MTLLALTERETYQTRFKKRRFRALRGISCAIRITPRILLRFLFCTIPVRNIIQFRLDWQLIKPKIEKTI